METPEKTYRDFCRKTAVGWNTWNVSSILTHVLLPEAFALIGGVKEYRDEKHLRALRKEDRKVLPGLRADDGSYTDLTFTWGDITLRVQTASEGEEWFMLVEPLKMQKRVALFTLEAGILWNRPGFCRRNVDRLELQGQQRKIDVFAIGVEVQEPFCGATGPYFALELSSAVGFCTSRRRSLEELKTTIGACRRTAAGKGERWGENREVFEASHACLAWNTIYDPLKDRVITPVDRVWCDGWAQSGGWILFEWDTFFAAWMFSFESKELAFANAIAITDEIQENGIIPNFSRSNGFASKDRSEPPVGAWVCRELYRKFPEKWFIAYVYPKLLKWNQWWWDFRRNGGKNLFSWGSDPYEPIYGQHWETKGVHQRLGASLESGLDNSPMYDDIAFNEETNMLELWDVGLSSLYVKDCEALAEIAQELNQDGEARKLRQRAEAVRKDIKEMLWNEDAGIFMNRHTDSLAFNPRIGPPVFYAMLAKAATPEQAATMVRDHLLNPDEFWGEWVIPSISRADPSYSEQSYWRGRVWGPMNFLTYISLCEYDLPDARKALVEKSKALLLKCWRSGGCVRENYNAETGDEAVAEGMQGGSSFYYWGGLLGTIALMEQEKNA